MNWKNLINTGTILPNRWCRHIDSLINTAKHSSIKLSDKWPFFCILWYTLSVSLFEIPRYSTEYPSKIRILSYSFDFQRNIKLNCYFCSLCLSNWWRIVPYGWNLHNSQQAQYLLFNTFFDKVSQSSESRKIGVDKVLFVLSHCFDLVLF